MVQIEKGMKLMGMATSMEYKIINGVFKKLKTRMCDMGNPQIEGIHFDWRNLHASVLKAAEVRLLAELWLKDLRCGSRPVCKSS